MEAPSEVMVVAALRTELLFVREPKAALGVGKKAQVRLRLLLSRFRPAGVAIVGYAGGLSPDLGPGALVLPDLILDEEGSVPVDQRLLSLAQRRLPRAAVGPLFTAEKLVSPREKEVLAERALAVDMETSLLVRELLARSIPFLVGRVILDAREERVSARSLLWAGRALRCSWLLRRVSSVLCSALSEGSCA